MYRLKTQNNKHVNLQLFALTNTIPAHTLCNDEPVFPKVSLKYNFHHYHFRVSKRISGISEQTLTMPHPTQFRSFQSVFTANHSTDSHQEQLMAEVKVNVCHLYSTQSLICRRISSVCHRQGQGFNLGYSPSLHNRLWTWQPYSHTYSTGKNKNSAININN